MKLLKDTNSEVQGMAMKCLPHLAAFVETQNAVYLMEKLLDHVLDNSDARRQTGAPDNVGTKAVRDVASFGLKSILTQLTPSAVNAKAISVNILPRLIKTISVTTAGGDATDVLIESLELVYEVLNRMGGLVAEKHVQITDAVFIQLLSSSPLVRKRAIACIGALGAVCDNHLFHFIVDKILVGLQNPSSHEAIRTGVRAVRALSNNSGHRLGKHLQTLVPILFGQASPDNHNEDDDLRENCLQALESLCVRCRREMMPFVRTLTRCIIILAKYDPNYIVEDDDGDEEEEEGMVQEDDMDNDYDDDDYSDDDDSSWKVRRAAIKCLSAVIRAELLPAQQLCSQFGPFLISRFREREEQVRLDVFAAFIDLLRRCSSRFTSKYSSVNGVADEADGTDVMAIEGEIDAQSDLEPLIAEGSRIVKNIKKELASRSLKTRTKAMSVMRELITALPSLLTPLVGKIIKEVELGLGDSVTAMKTESLLFLRGVVREGGAEALQDYIDVLIPKVLSATDDRYYKVTAECLRFCSAALVSFGTSSLECRTKMAALAPAIYDATVRRATAQDQDSEVKEAALDCLSGSVSYFGRDLGSQRLTDMSGILCDRLGNEVTRLATVRAMHNIAVSESAEVLLSVMNEVAGALSSFLRKNNPSLRTATLELLCVAPSLPTANDAELIGNITELVSDSDLRVTSLALKLSTRIVKLRGYQIVGLVGQPHSVYNRVIELSKSALLQGRAVESLLGFFRSLSETNAEPLTPQKILEDLKQSASFVVFNVSTSAAHSSSLYCIAKCVVVVCDAADPELRARFAQQIIENVTSQDFKERVFSLACLGEFGRSSLLAREGNEKEMVRDAIISALVAVEEEVRTAAAISLGGLASGDRASGVPWLINLVKQRPDQRYLLLLSLKEAISSSRKADVGQLTSILIPTLLEHSASSSNGMSGQGEVSGEKRSRTSEEESVRTAAAECLGLLTQVSPDAVMPALVAGAVARQQEVRAVVAAGLKFAVSTNHRDSSALSALLRSSLGNFIGLIGDSDVSVAKNALQAVNAIAKSRPSLLTPLISDLLNLIYARTAKDKTLIRVVDLGPFKHEEDYGLELRKSAFDCLRTFMSGSLRSSVPLIGMLQHITHGLRDQSDVRAIAQLILAIAASSESAPQMIEVMDPIVQALECTFNEKVKENAVRQESERHEDSIRGALRAVRVMETVPEIVANRKFHNLLHSVVRMRYADKYEAIGKNEVDMATFGSMSKLEARADRTREEDVMTD